MSLQAIRPYVTARLEGLGYAEHIDPFNDENIPSSLLDNGFHQLILSITGADKTNSSQGLDVSVQVKVFFKGFRNPEEALTQGIEKSEEIISEVTMFKNFQGLAKPITGVFLDSLNFEPYDEGSNDNIIQAVFVFRFLVYTCVE